MATKAVEKTITTKKVTLTGNIDGCDVYEITVGKQMARVRLEAGLSIRPLLDILLDLKELSAYGRHDISRIHLFRATDSIGQTFTFAMTYSQLPKLARIAGIASAYVDIDRHCSAPISMKRRFKEVVLLNSMGIDENENVEDETFEDYTASNAGSGWDHVEGDMSLWKSATSPFFDVKN